MILQRMLDELWRENLFIDIWPPGSLDTSMSISGQIRTDTRRIKEGDVFACIPGFNVDGHDLAPAALGSGASLLIVEHFLEVPLPQVKVSDCRKATAILARLFYGDPTSRFELIGVTGTNGKTTTTYIIEKLLKELKIKTGLIGTLGYRIGERHYSLERTTPDILELNEIFVKMVEAGCKVVVMEVSSHSLALHRVYGLHFRQAIFTNLTQDHLDFHKDLHSYYTAKIKLFKMTEATAGLCIVNADDAHGRKIQKTVTCKCRTYTLQGSKNAFASANNIRLNNNGSVFDLKIGNLEFSNLTSPLPARFNIYNLLAALVSVKQYCETTPIFTQLLQAIPSLSPVPGRMQEVKNDQNITIFIDYAHTPDALQNILGSIAEYRPQRLIAVWGCGGDRDRLKRPEMAKISVGLADLTIITTDNPRHEHPADIIRDIVEPLAWEERYIIISDRSEAIKAAILIAGVGDIVVIAGKGHEDYQEIGDERVHFSDVEEVLRALEYRRGYVPIENKLAVPFDVLNLEKLTLEGMSQSAKTPRQPTAATPLTEGNSMDCPLMFTSIVTDSRVVSENTLFIAIKGERFDGADYVEEVVARHEGNWCLTNASVNTQQRVLVSEIDTLELYGRLAQKYLQLFSLQKIAITGSTGKTTTKEILHNILSVKYNTFKAFGNENNQIGVPQNIFRLQPQHQFAILEIGTNQIGEIEYLSKIYQPHYALVVSINASHLSGLKSEENIRQEKLSMLRYTSKIAVIPCNQEYQGSSCIKVLSFGKESGAEFRYSVNIVEEKGLEIVLNNEVFHANTQVPFFDKNYAVAIALAKLLGLTHDEIEQGLQRDLHLPDRMEIVEQNGRTIIFDCYNANPTSMVAAIEYWASLSNDKEHYAILGDMLELGENERDYHNQIAQTIQMVRKANYCVIGVGSLARLYNPDQHYLSVDELIKSTYIQQINQQSVILVKGSHSIKLEQLKGVL